MITITNLTRSPLPIVCSRATNSQTVTRVHASPDGHKAPVQKHITIGTSLRLRAGETSKPLADSYKHEPEIQKLVATGKIRLTNVE